MAEYVIDTKRTFVNPYNFVPVDFQNTERAAAVQEESGLTGRIECRILCKTPIAIPDAAGAASAPEGQSKHYEFFRINGQPVIPASAIRGMIRSVFETATNSCFSTMKPETRLTRRSMSSEGLKPGILKKEENGQWILYASRRYMLKTRRFPSRGNNGRNESAWEESICPFYEVQDDKEEGKYLLLGESGKKEQRYSGDKVYFGALQEGGREVSYSSRRGFPCGSIVKKTGLKKTGTEPKEGYLLLGEPISNKHHDSIFLDTTQDKKNQVKIDQKKMASAMAGLEETLNCYRNESVNRNLKTGHKGYRSYERMKEQGIIPLWYDDRGGRLLFSLAAIGRLAFEKTLNVHVGSKAPCSSRRALCPACRMFGMVSETGEQDACAGKVRFTDAGLISGGKPEWYTLAELGGPHPSYMPFYSDAKAEAYAKGYPGYDDPGVHIRGRKFYWHSENFEKLNARGDVPEKQNGRNSVMEVMKGAFHFTVFFENMTEAELKRLVWSINFWENREDGTLMHKIGHGKPIGLGSVKLLVDEIRLRSFGAAAAQEQAAAQNVCGGYEEKPYEIRYGETPPVDTDSAAVRALLLICDFSNKKDVHYPYVGSGLEKGEEAYNWFVENRQVRKGDTGDKVQRLPDILGRPLKQQSQKPQPQELYAMQLRNSGTNSAGGRRNGAQPGTFSRGTANGGYPGKRSGAPNGNPDGKGSKNGSGNKTGGANDYHDNDSGFGSMAGLFAKIKLDK